MLSPILAVISRISTLVSPNIEARLFQTAINAFPTKSLMIPSIAKSPLNVRRSLSDFSSSIVSISAKALSALVIAISMSAFFQAISSASVVP